MQFLRRMVPERFGIVSLCMIVVGAVTFFGSEIAHIYRTSDEAGLRSLSEDLGRLAHSELDHIVLRLRHIAAQPSAVSNDYAEFEKLLRAFASTDERHYVVHNRNLQSIVTTSPVGISPSGSIAPRELQKVLAGADPYISELRPNRATNEMQFAVRVPIRDAHFQGVLTALVKPAVLQRALAERMLPPGISAGILDQKGAIVARIPRGDAFLGSLAPAPIRQHLPVVEPRAIEFRDGEGNRSVGVLAKVPGTEWTAGVWSRARLSERAIDLLAQAGLGLIAFGIVLALAGHLMVARATR